MISQGYRSGLAYWWKGLNTWTNFIQWALHTAAHSSPQCFLPVWTSALNTSTPHEQALSIKMTFLNQSRVRQSKLLSALSKQLPTQLQLHYTLPQLSTSHMFSLYVSSLSDVDLKISACTHTYSSHTLAISKYRFQTLERCSHSQSSPSHLLKQLSLL